MKYVCFYCYALIEEKDVIQDENGNIICNECYESQHKEDVL
jgi:hypothetical protein